MAYRILLPVDGSEGSLRAARHVAAMARLIPGLEVHVLSVQAPGDDWMVRRLITPEELAELEQEWSKAAMDPACDILKDAGIEPHCHLAQGEVAASIVRLAQELGCDQIVMGTRGQSTLAGLLMGSVATKVLHLSPIPVTLVK
ncbi:MAG: universal stress protein [Thiobacillaceae bacterium]|nr:universal stress protein [Thiobacillaceae bacterium]MCX7672600.1 universal stress protein [Thiobacillaceae bacterium]MDW8322540.1 universal stress protein [Burkholderiales bacterium]